MFQAVWLSIALLCDLPAVAAQTPTEPQITRANVPQQVAEGVYVIRHRGAAANSGNTVIIIGEREILVVDSCFQPSVARRDIAQLRQLSDKPVRYLLNTHWHNDHNAGNGVYLETFPGLAVIAHVETKKDMDLHIRSYPARLLAGIAAQRQRLAASKDEDGKPLTEDGKAELAVLLAQRQSLADEYKTTVYQSPTLTFEHEMNIDLGNREVQIKYLGRGNTSGDAVAYLPKERVLITGDLLVHPLPYTYDGYPTDWIKTLDRLRQFDAQVIVPGHGEVLRDKTYLHAVRDLLSSAVEQINARLRQVGPAEFLTFDAVKGSIDLTPLQQSFVGASAESFEAMAARLIKLVFNEAVLR